jgi:hypothetical protein
MSGIRSAGEYQLTDLKLFTGSGEVVNLDNIYVSLDIYENMFSNGLTGTLMIVDTNNLIMNAPITGQEFLSFKIKTPTIDNVSIDFTKHVMTVYKIDLRKAERGNEVIQLHFCSPELLRNSRTRLSKSYEGNISDIVRKVLEDAKSVNTKKDLFIEDTLGLKKIVSPNKNPYSLIRDLTTDAIAINGSPHFVFFENIDGIHFRTLDSLYNQGSTGEFIASDRGPIDFQKGGITNIVEDLKRVLDYQMASNNDTKRNIKSGMFGSKTISHNIYEKNFDVKIYDYFEEFEKYGRVSAGESDFPIYNKAPVDFANNLSSFNDAKIYMHSTSKDSSGFDTQHYKGTDTNYTPNDIQKTIAFRTAKNTELDNGVKINMEINGNTTIRTGSIIDFQLPIVGTNHTGDAFDVYHSGKFLITKARHNFNRTTNAYKIYLSTVKDSFNKELPDGGSEAQQPTGGQL